LREKRDFHVLGRKFNKLNKANSREQTNIQDNMVGIGTTPFIGQSQKINLNMNPQELLLIVSESE